MMIYIYIYIYRPEIIILTLLQDDMWASGQSLEARLNDAYHEFQSWTKSRKIPYLWFDICFMRILIEKKIRTESLGTASHHSVMGNSFVALMQNKWPLRATTFLGHSNLQVINFDHHDRKMPLNFLRLVSSYPGLLTLVCTTIFDTQTNLSSDCSRSWCILTSRCRKYNRSIPFIC